MDRTVATGDSNGGGSLDRLTESLTNIYLTVPVALFLHYFSIIFFASLSFSSLSISPGSEPGGQPTSFEWESIAYLILIAPFDHVWIIAGIGIGAFSLAGLLRQSSKSDLGEEERGHKDIHESAILKGAVSIGVYAISLFVITGILRVILFISPLPMAKIESSSNSGWFFLLSVTFVLLMGVSSINYCVDELSISVKESKGRKLEMTLRSLNNKGGLEGFPVPARVKALVYISKEHSGDGQEGRQVEHFTISCGMLMRFIITADLIFAILLGSILWFSGVPGIKNIILTWSVVRVWAYSAAWFQRGFKPHSGARKLVTVFLGVMILLLVAVVVLKTSPSSFPSLITFGGITIGFLVVHYLLLVLSTSRLLKRKKGNTEGLGDRERRLLLFPGPVLADLGWILNQEKFREYYYLKAKNLDPDIDLEGWLPRRLPAQPSSLEMRLRSLVGRVLGRLLLRDSEDDALVLIDIDDLMTKFWARQKLGSGGTTDCYGKSGPKA